MEVASTCSACGAVWSGGVATCPKCGSSPQNISVRGGVTFPKIGDELHAVLTSPKGIAAERYHRSGPGGEVRTSIDAGGPLKAERTDAARCTKLDAENAVTRSFAAAHNRAYGTKWHARDRKIDRGEFADGEVLDANNNLIRSLQIRKLDDRAAAALGKTLRHKDEVAEAALVKTIQDAISAKSSFDADAKATHDLVLEAPYPLGEMLRGELSTEPFDLFGWRAVWILAEGDELLQLAAAAPHPPADIIPTDADEPHPVG